MEELMGYALSTLQYTPLALFALGVFSVSFASCIVIIRFSNKSNLFIDNVSSNKPQKFHSQNTPRAGGIGIFLAFFVGIGLLHLLEILSGQILWLFLGCLIIFASGLVEDFSSKLSPRARLLAQCVGAFLICYCGNTYIFDLNFGFHLPYTFAIIFSIFALVGVANALNIIDGFNGLAGGVCLLIFGSIAYVAWGCRDLFVFYASAISIVAILGFFVLNFPKGRIFLGDGGAYFLGFLAGLLLVKLTQGREGVSAWFGLAIMIYAVWEVLFSIFRKKLARKSPMQPDESHFHMLVFIRVKSNPKTSLLILGLNAPFIIFASIFSSSSIICIGVCIIFILVYLLIYTRLAKNKDKIPSK